VPDIYVIGGPNGAGKTTSAIALMPELLECDEYVNADAIAAGLSPFKPDGAAIEAGRLMLARIHSLANKNVSFAFETTMASRSLAIFARGAAAKGYRIHVLYLWLRSPELAVARVAERVAQGGHSVPEEVIRRRYVSGLRNFMRLYLPICDAWTCYDNSDELAQLIANKEIAVNATVMIPNIWNAIVEAAQ